LRAGFERLAKKHGVIGDIRGKGLFQGIEFVRNLKTKERFPAERLSACGWGGGALENGLLCRFESALDRVRAGTHFHSGADRRDGGPPGPKPRPGCSTRSDETADGSEGRELMIRIGIGLLIVGAILAAVGFQEWSVARTATKQPEEISLKDLIARGAEGNPNIILKDYELCDNFVYETKGGTSWTHVWVPIVPRGTHPAGQPFRPQKIDCPHFQHQSPQRSRAGRALR